MFKLFFGFFFFAINERFVRINRKKCICSVIIRIWNIKIQGLKSLNPVWVNRRLIQRRKMFEPESKPCMNWSISIFWYFWIAPWKSFFYWNEMEKSYLLYTRNNCEPFQSLDVWRTNDRLNAKPNKRNYSHFIKLIYISMRCMLTF